MKQCRLLLPSIILLFTFLFILTACQEPVAYIPPRVNLSEAKYERFLDSLKANRERGDKFREALYLANLFADEGLIYENATAGIDQDKSHCFNILTWDSLASNFGFEVSLYANMPKNWPKLVTYCKDKLAPGEFNSKRSADLNKAEMRRQKLLTDSVDFDKDLIKRLDIVHKNDQLYRGQLMRNPTDSLWDLQNQLDSINLIFVDSLLAVRSWPGPREVGEHGTTLWLVLHHQGNLRVREKYVDVLHKAYDEGKISKSLYEGFMDRTQNAKESSNLNH